MNGIFGHPNIATYNNDTTQPKRRGTKVRNLTAEDKHLQKRIDELRAAAGKPIYMARWKKRKESHPDAKQRQHIDRITRRRGGLVWVQWEAYGANTPGTMSHKMAISKFLKDYYVVSEQEAK